MPSPQVLSVVRAKAYIDMSQNLLRLARAEMEGGTPEEKLADKIWGLISDLDVMVWGKVRVLCD